MESVGQRNKNEKMESVGQRNKNEKMESVGQRNKNEINSVGNNLNLLR
jgi:hypothetical protein